MEPALTLREAFAGLAGHDGAGNPADPTALAGHEGLPADLVITAIGSYADTAPAEVAEHLSAFVAAPTGVEDGLHLLAEVPAEIPAGEVSLAGIHEPVGDGLFDVPNHDLDFHDLGNADSLDALDGLDHAPVTPHLTEATTHDADFGHSAPAAEAHEVVPESHTDLDDVSLEDVSHEALPGPEGGFEADTHLDASEDVEPEHHGDDGHHDHGLDHFAG